jgi:predicted nucleic acid-binding protein
MILDTNFLGALDAGESGAREVAESIETEQLPARIPTPVVFEVFYGIEGADDPDEILSRYEALFASKPRVELSDQAAHRGGRLFARHEVSDEKRRLDLVDAMVAAAALELGEPVVTNDAAFQDVDGLRVRTY